MRGEARRARGEKGANERRLSPASYRFKTSAGNFLRTMANRRTAPKGLLAVPSAKPSDRQKIKLSRVPARYRRAKLEDKERPLTAQSEAGLRFKGIPLGLSTSPTPRKSGAYTKITYIYLGNTTITRVIYYYYYPFGYYYWGLILLIVVN